MVSMRDAAAAAMLDGHRQLLLLPLLMFFRYADSCEA